MATFEDIALSGQAFAQENMGDAFSYANTSMTGVFAFIATDLMLEAQGVRQEADGVLVASKAQFTAANVTPTIRANVVYSGANYSIRDIQTDTQAYTLQLKKLS
jgi:hypothetical protein